jgi:uncharacterized protein with PIN domain
MRPAYRNDRRYLGFGRLSLSRARSRRFYPAHLRRGRFLDLRKGRHKAAFNYGDCFSYALAKATGEPLLFKCNDFNKTDIKAA